MRKNNSKDSLREVVAKDFRVNKSLYAMMIPIFVFYICFHYIPMFGTVIAFKDYIPTKGIFGSPWVGMKHFASFINGPYFWTVLRNTLRISLSTIVFSFPMPIILALLLNEIKNAKYAKLVQNITYMPHFISLVVVCGMIKSFTMDTGVINSILALFGFERKTMLLEPGCFVPVYVISGIWQEVGWNSIVYLAALTSIDMELYEAARIDGAGRWRQTLSITIPSIVPTIVIMLILKVGGILNVGFEKIILLYNDATSPVAEVISSYVYKKGLIEQSWSYSSAVGLFNSVINFIFLISTNKISKKLTETSIW